MWRQLLAAGSSTDLAQYGPLGVAVMALAAFARAAYNRERDRSDRLELELTASRARELAMAEKMGTEVTAVLIEAARALQDREPAPRRRRES